MKLKCKKCGKKLVHHNKKGYCQDCLKLGVVALGIYKCIEPECNEKVSGPNKRCISCGHKITDMKRRKPKITYYYIAPKCKKCGKKLNKNNTTSYCQDCLVYHCIEPNCNVKVSGPDKRCKKHGYKIISLKLKKPKVTYHCIEPKCNEKVSGPDRRCLTCAGIKRRKPKQPKVIYHCIEPNCNKEVSGPDRRCKKHGYEISSLKLKKPKITYYCIEPNCKNKVYAEGNRCNSCAGLKRRKPKVSYYCREKDCNNEVSREGNRCKECGRKAAGLKRRKPKQPKITYYCIKPDCNNEVSRKGNTCTHCAVKGKNNYNWKGGITDLNLIIRYLSEYNEWRTKVFERDNYTCQDCNKGREMELHVHHKKYFSVILSEFLQQYSQFSPIEDKETLARLAMTYEPFWDVNNGVTLCKECHEKINHRNIKNV